MKSENLPSQVAPPTARRKARVLLAVGLPAVLLLTGLAYQSGVTQQATSSAVAAPTGLQTVQLHKRGQQAAPVSPGYEPGHHPLVSVRNVAPAPAPAAVQKGMITVGPDGKVPTLRRPASSATLNTPITAGTTSAGGQIADLNPAYHPFAVAHNGPDGKPCVSCIDAQRANSGQKKSTRGHAGHSH